MILLNIISFYLEQSMMLLFGDNHLFVPLFSIVSLIMSYHLLRKKESIIIVGLILGLVYDISLTQTLFLNTLIFLLLSIIVLLYYKYVTYNMINTIVITILSIIVYRLLSYITYIVLFDRNISFIDLLTSIYRSLIINIVYVITLQILLKKKILKLKNVSIYSY